MITNIIRGFIIGVGKIIPGVSGSMLAILMGVYERALNILANLRNLRFNDFIFIVSLAFGVFLSVSMLSKGVTFCLDHLYFWTILLFIGLISSGIPELWNRGFGNNGVKSVNVKSLIVVALAFLLSLVMTVMGEISLSSSNLENMDMKAAIELVPISFTSILLFFLVGLLEAFASIVPGISGTAIFMALGCYELLLSIYGNIFNLNYWLFILAFFGGVIVGVLVLARFISFLLSRYAHLTYLIILGFLLSSIVLMFWMLWQNSEVTFTFNILFKGMLIIVIGFWFGKKINILLSKD